MFIFLLILKGPSIFMIVFFLGVSYWIKSSVSLRDGLYFSRQSLNIATYCCERLTNTLTATSSGDYSYGGYLSSVKFFMNNTCIHFEWKVLSSMLSRHEKMSKLSSFICRIHHLTAQVHYCLVHCMLLQSLTGWKYQLSKQVV